MKTRQIFGLIVTVCLFGVFTPVANAAVAKEVAAGQGHTIVVKTDGTVWAWGYNYYGQLGNGDWLDQYTPVQVAGLDNVATVTAGGEHSLAARSDGTVWAWGRNTYGQLGLGNLTDQYNPVPVVGLSNVSGVAAGWEHSLALKADGTVWAWGHNGRGALGNGDTTNRDTPTQVSGLGNVVTVVAWGAHSLALRSDGTVWAWGSGTKGELGDGNWSDSSLPVQVYGLDNVNGIAAGSVHGLAVKTDGSVWAWGLNERGQLGDGSTTDENTPVQVVGLSNVVAIAAGAAHSLALKDDGTIWAWGDNSSGQLGDGNTTNSLTPVQVAAWNWIVAIEGGASHSVARAVDCTVWAWGSNSYGQLGDGTTTSTNLPEQVAGMPGCSPDISPTSATVAAEGGTNSVSVTIDGDCYWGATNEFNWLTILSPDVSQGPATLTYAVAPNPAATWRTGTLIIASHIFTVQQEPRRVLTLTQVQVKLNFAKPSADSCSLKGTLNMDAGVNLAGTTATLSVGSIQVPFVLDGKGRGKSTSPVGSLSLAYSKGKEVWTLTAKLTKGSFQASCAEYGLTNANINTPGITVQMPVTLSVEGETFATNKSLVYTAKYNRTGTAK
jgi:alpha-tubulin suppressor-like RCC1 family protein